MAGRTTAKPMKLTILFVIVVGVILVWWLRSVSDYSVLRRCALNECENGIII
jgi:hypothetical protein